MKHLTKTTLLLIVTFLALSSGTTLAPAVGNTTADCVACTRLMHEYGYWLRVANNTANHCLQLADDLCLQLREPRLVCDSLTTVLKSMHSAMSIRLGVALQQMCVVLGICPIR
mmetsp:Transcript_80147/g.141416  ORF Transcript_80147/g.141416 Transcript_80147/m.141416 type:complete len:113 (-) Transcript_80147:11-349(-)